VRSTRRLGFLLCAFAVAAGAQLLSARVDVLVVRTDAGPIASVGVARHDHSAVVPRSDLSRVRRAPGDLVPVAFASAWAIAALAAGWLLRVARRRDRVSRPIPAFQGRGPPFLPVVA
jgi:hypothetical protein